MKHKVLTLKQSCGAPYGFMCIICKKVVSLKDENKLREGKCSGRA